MDDRQQILSLYECMYKAMIAKDIAVLDSLHADDFVLVHMTGMRQPKQVYLRSIADGTLNYYSAEHEQMDVSVDEDSATLTGRSRVEAAVFGGSRHTWRLQLCFKLARRQGKWLFLEARASAY
ncbi:MAG: nuclear transport factor 2 family protein [Prevotella sp.]|nr:nuclear transport factor 2 family protein [Prevotella sp.]